MSAPFVPDGVKVRSVSEVNREVKGLLEGELGQVWVAGEVSGLKKHTSGHWYLKLKDADALLSTVIYRGVNLRLKFDLRDGLKVVARGMLTVYVPRGEYQFQVEQVQPEGIGPLELAFRQLKEKLSAAGYFEPRRKKPLPRFPRRVVLVTSPTGAAVRDMLEIINRRWPAVEVWVCPVPVQGDGAAEKIAQAIGRLNRIRGIDVMIVGRGGGSLEDLWAFNEECLAEAIYRSRIPVISAVGHETDYTIADMVADKRAETPSAAATLVVPDRQELAKLLDGVYQRMRKHVDRRLDWCRSRLDALAGRRCFGLPLDRIREAERRLDEWGERLGRAAKGRVVLARQRVEAAAARLESLSPLNVLGRGYSLTRREADRVVVRHPEQVRPGDRLVTQVQGGRILSRVEESPAGPGASSPPHG
ncbi:MAG TPA: exodeoxyribonuclease VII large subunit [Gemmataceae bacterium]|nr:exodeoxyribonuclease VII large subunit [Gemmataceae bacterium]